MISNRQIVTEKMKSNTIMTGDDKQRTNCRQGMIISNGEAANGEDEEQQTKCRDDMLRYGEAGDGG